MPRKPRVEFAGAVYHVLCRGDRREAIFWDDKDRFRFLDTLAEARERSGWLLHAYVLMANHYHLLLETPETNLVAGMRWFQGTYTIRFNHRHGLSGHLFQGRYKALLIDPEEDGHFLRVSTYIHLNPVRAKLVRAGEEPISVYRWSSLPEYLKAPSRRPPWLTVDRVLGALELPDTSRGRKAYGAYMERGALEVRSRTGKAALEAEWKPIRRGWVLGSDSFVEKMRDRVDVVLAGGSRSSYSGPAVTAHDEAEAERIVRLCLPALDLTEEDLPALRKLDHRKQMIAWWVRRHTLVTNRWVSERLAMGHPGNLSRVVKDVNEGNSKEMRRLKRKVEQAGKY